MGPAPPKSPNPALNSKASPKQDNSILSSEKLSKTNLIIDSSSTSSSNISSKDLNSNPNSNSKDSKLKNSNVEVKQRRKPAALDLSTSNINYNSSKSMDLAIKCISPGLPQNMMRDMKSAVILSKTIEAKQRELIAQRTSTSTSFSSSSTNINNTNNNNTNNNNTNNNNNNNNNNTVILNQTPITTQTIHAPKRSIDNLSTNSYSAKRSKKNVPPPLTTLPRRQWETPSTIQIAPKSAPPRHRFPWYPTPIDAAPTNSVQSPHVADVFPDESIRMAPVSSQPFSARNEVFSFQSNSHPQPQNLTPPNESSTKIINKNNNDNESESELDDVESNAIEEDAKPFKFQHLEIPNPKNFQHNPTTTNGYGNGNDNFNGNLKRRIKYRYGSQSQDKQRFMALCSEVWDKYYI